MKTPNLLSAVLILVLLASLPASAAQKRASKKKQTGSAEIFQAYEADPQDLPADAMVPVAPAAAAQQCNLPKFSFDPVPNDLMDPIVKRIQLVTELVILHGRAYDYRIHTVAELEAILKSFKSDEE